MVVPNSLPHGWSKCFLEMAAAIPPAGAHGVVFQSFAPALLFRHHLEDAGMHSFAAGASPQVFDRAGPSWPAPAVACVYAGAPHTKGGEAVLYDSEIAPTERRFAADHLRALSVRFPAGVPVDLDPHVVVLIYVDDPATPRARVRLVDLVAGDERPLNIALLTGCRLIVALSDPNGRWAAGGPRLEVHLRA